MLTLYKGLFNTDVSNYYLFKDFSLFKQELEQYKVLQVDSNYYRMNDLHIVIDVDTATINCYDLNYMIMEEQQIHKCYFINDFYYDNSGLHILLTLDLWGSAIDKAVLTNTNVYATNKFIGTGYYQPITNCNNFVLESKPEKEFISPDNLYCVFLLNFNKKESIFSQTAQSKTELLCFNIGKTKRDIYTSCYEYLVDKNPNITLDSVIKKYNNNTIDLISELVSDISTINIDNNNYKCEVIKCYIIESDFIKVNEKQYYNIASNYGLLVGLPTTNFNVFKVNASISIKPISIPLNINSQTFYGTRLSYTQVKRFTNESKLLYLSKKVIITNDSVEVKVIQGTDEFDLTNSFIIDLTLNKANVTKLQAINNQIKSFNSIFSSVANIGANVANKNYVGAVSSGIDLVGGMVDKAANLPIGQYVNAGDAINTFRNNSPITDSYNEGAPRKIQLVDCLGPFYTTSFASINNEHDILFTKGYICDVAISISDIIKSKELVDLNQVSNNLKNGFNTYIKAITNVSNVPLDYANYIKKVFANGARFKVLGNY